MANATSAAVRPYRAIPSLREALIGMGTGLGLALIAFSSGGYFPTAWGWGALAALTLIAGYLVVGTAVRPTTIALVSLGGLTGFGAWTWLALLWTDDTAGTVLEGQRVLLYVSALAALILLVRRLTIPWLLAATLVAVFLASGYGLASRLFPRHLGVFDPVASYRLEEPLTYWNALGIFAAMGVLLALGFAARARSLVSRVAGAATLPVLFATLYFTYSRGAWIAGALGLAAAVAIDSRRLQLLVTALVLAPAPALTVLISSHQKALTRTDTIKAAAEHEGHRLAFYVLLFVAVEALIAAGLVLAARRVTPSPTARLAFGGTLAAVAVVGVLGVLVHYGGPIELVRKGYDSFTTTTTKTSPVNLNTRLFTFSGSHRSELWKAAWQDYEANPVLGSGPGTYEQYWLKHRKIVHKVKDAHNLYLEVLAETGPVGLILLVLALGAPLVAGIAARAHPLVPAAMAAYVAYLLHAAVDWDWEMSAVTLAALFCAAALLAAVDPRESSALVSPGIRWSGTAVALLLAVVAFVGLVGASALSASMDALDKGKYGEARSQARKAARWWRWSPDPWQQLGDTQSAQGDLAAAGTSYRKAISKNRSDWMLWYDLSSVSEGRAADQALAEAKRLNPFFESDLEGTGSVTR